MNSKDYIYRGVVDRVIDGDTISVLVDVGFHITVKERFRLAGIDTPELRGGTEETKRLANAAKDWVEEQILGKEVVVKSSKQGKFGRYIGTIYLGEMNINKELVKLGHAKPYK